MSILGAAVVGRIQRYMLPCIPSQSNDKVHREIDWWQYKERSNVECFFQRLKQYRRIATRYEKLAVRFLAFVHLGCALIWLK